MLPRAKRVVLKSSEVEEYKKKSLIGHWILVKESKENSRKECDVSSKKVVYRGDDDDPRQMPADTRFVAHNITAVGTDSAEGYLNVSGRGYRHVDGERFSDHRQFDRVNTVNADDNSLRLASFRTFRSVRRLSLRRNRLESVDPIDGDLFETLIHLDVSENSLNPDDLYQLSLTNLEQLYMSANNLKAVPERISNYHSFLSLKFLDLSKNHLSCPKTFYILSTLHNLRELNMSDNQISLIPCLISKQLYLNLSIMKIIQKHQFIFKPCTFKLYSLMYKLRINVENSVNIECTKKEKNAGFNQDEDTIVYDNKDNVNEHVYHVQHIPFVSLNSIDLSNNLIDQRSSVLPLICWPSLTNVTLTANTISLRKNLPMFKKLKSILSLYNIKINRL